MRDWRPPISYCVRRSLALRQFSAFLCTSADFSSDSLAAFAWSCWRLRNACSCSAAVLGAALLAGSPFAALSADAAAGAAAGAEVGLRDIAPGFIPAGHGSCE